MKGHLRFFLLAIGLACLPSHGALENTSRIGAEMKLLIIPDANVIAYGWRYMYSPSEFFSMGGVGYTGQLTGAADTGSYSYGGLSASFNWQATEYFRMELGITAGGGGGFRSSTGLQLGGALVEPNFNLAFQLGRNVGLAATGGYIWMPTSAIGSGYSVGLRLEFNSDRPAPVSRQAPAQQQQ